ncbi:hypothetical protein QJS04_geneDACA000145 [Acorus gramineus]|uniref:Ribonuclease H1 N-terminal domain-containing protein n=1 Tax=Acorus gramineus TaxID=55184 RepID=A0AAV9ANX1_ACOGR|nr:hypothetical protein QJS04_geneDACA000145 [Acorus gramineus]
MSSASVFSQSSSHFMVRRSLCGFSRLIQKRNARHTCRFTIVKLNLVLTGFHVQCYSSRRTRSLKVDPGSSMEEEKNAFYVVRKGNMVGVYKSLSDCQDQVSSSICDPSVGVYKGYSLSKEAQEYLASRGLRNPMYTIDAADVKEDLFGSIVPCPFQIGFIDCNKNLPSLNEEEVDHNFPWQPDSSDGNKLRKISPQKRSSESVELFRNSIVCDQRFDTHITEIIEDPTHTYFDYDVSLDDRIISKAGEVKEVYDH